MHLSHPVQNLLFICIGGIGDLIFLTPALKMLSARWPAARYHFLLTPSGSRAVVERHPQAGEILEVLPAVGAFFRRLFSLRKLRPDLVFAATGTNPRLCGLIGLCSGARYRMGEAYNAGRLLYNIKCPYDDNEHEIVSNIKIASMVTGNGKGPHSCMIWTTAEDRAKAAALMEDASRSSLQIGLHLGSGPAMAFKRWPSDRFVEVGKRIRERHNARIVLFGGSDEQEESDAAAEAIGGGTRSFAGRLSVRETFEAMKQCRLFISNDSGPMHLAATAGCRVIALFGPTQARKTGPWGDGHQVIIAGMDCQPCYHFRTKKVGCPAGDCMKRISVEQVVECSGRVIQQL